jgi:lysophospholipase L1-like esterase
MRVLVFGDSVAWGEYDKEFGGWVNRLRTDLMLPRAFNQVYNLSVSGKSSEDVLNIFENSCQYILKCKHKKDAVVIISAGMNDCQYLKSQDNLKIPPIQFKKNLKLMIKIAQKYASHIIFLGLYPIDESKLNPIPWSTDKFCKNNNIKVYDKILKEEAQKNKIHFISIYNELDSGLMAEDGLHPNAKGHKKIYTIIKDRLKKEGMI